jgi:multiple sugar transport system permease protein
VSVTTLARTIAERQRNSPARRDRVLPYVLVAPLVIFVIGLGLIPGIFTAVEAFFRVTPFHPPTAFAGLDNFVALAKNSAVRVGAVNTLLYVVIGVALATVIGVGMAVTLQRPFRFRSAVIAAMILPWALPGVVESVIWTWIYDPNSGVLNSVLHSLHIISDYHVWIANNRIVAITFIEIVQVWQMAPLCALLILAALQAIPDELYEAARMDGCNAWRAFWRITVPLARPGIAIAMVQAVVNTLNIFDQAYLLNGASYTATSLMEQTYFITFQNLNFGQGYALSLVVTIATLVLSFLVVKLVYRKVEF